VRGGARLRRSEVADDARPRNLAVVAPSGYRVEGLDVETVVTLLARLV